jgi:Ca-activated chloride channel family protein
MKEKLSGQPKLELAKRVLEETMQRIPVDINVGLRVFGENLTMTMADCMQTALLVPLGQHNRGSIISRARELKASGMTPLTYALQQAAEDDFQGSEGKRTIILITDGVDTCGGNPCAFISMLPQYGIHIKIDVVGVDLHKGERGQLDCIAHASGGKYYNADTAAQMIDSISHSVDTAISGRVMIKNAKNTETPPELRPLHATPDTPIQQP